MPLTAIYDGAGMVDATLLDLGGAATWEQIHKVKPRALLTCRGCGQRVQAKVSVRGTRFFAHDAAVSDCPTNGETAAHRLLKSELAAAIRAAGWIAELEVAGTGWRADVLAVSPDGRRRVAWEAQLAPATVGDLEERTSTMTAQLDAVCWVTDKDVPWVCEVPSVRVRRDDEGQLVIARGAGRFEPNWCGHRSLCEYDFGYRRGYQGPCPGHGGWQAPGEVTLSRFVRSVCVGSLGAHRRTAWFSDFESRHGPGAIIWTTPTYVTLEAEQNRAEEARKRWEDQKEKALEVERKKREERIEALLARQRDLVKPTLDLVRIESGREPTVGEPERRYAMGLPILVNGRKPAALICPVASRIGPYVREQLGGMLVVVASEAERRRVAARCPSSTKVVVVPSAAPVD